MKYCTKWANGQTDVTGTYLYARVPGRSWLGYCHVGEENSKLTVKQAYILTPKKEEQHCKLALMGKARFKSF